MSYDDLLKRLGEFGRYQRRIYLLLCISVIPCAFHKLAGVFLNAKPEFRCRLPFESENSSFHQNETIAKLTRPWDSFSKSLSSCNLIDANYTSEYFDGGVPGNDSAPCSDWVFDDSTYKTSAVIEFLLICNRQWLRATADSLFMFGVLAGSYIFGDFSDRYGRRPTFIIALILELVGGLATALAPEYVTFVLGRILLGATASGTFLVAYVIALEMVGPTKRLFAGVFVHMFFSVSFLLIALIAYLTMDYSWRLFQVVITLIPGIFLMSYWWIIPESSRWLLSRGRHKEAKEIIKAIAKENKVDIPEDALDSLMENNTSVEEQPNGKVIVERQPNILDLFRHKSLLRRSLNIFFCWFVNSISYYGLSWSTSSLGANVYLNFCLSGLVEFPGYGILLFTLNRYGRKFTLCGALIVCGIALLMTIFVPPELNWLTITFAMIGKMAITSSYGTVYVFSTEQFPTVIRNVALGAASMSARVGGIMAPYINELAGYWKPLPLIIYGALCLVAGGFCLFLPETLNKTLPETIAEGEAFGKSKPDKVYAATIEEGITEPLKPDSSKG